MSLSLARHTWLLVYAYPIFNYIYRSSMAIAFLKPRALFPSQTKLQPGSKILNSVQYGDRQHFAVAVFLHHRDVRVALDELNCEGFPHDGLILVARQSQRCKSYSELITSTSFDARQFGKDPVVQKFFCQLFEQGKYLLLVDGSQHDLDVASKIVSRRRDRAKVWHFE